MILGWNGWPLDRIFLLFIGIAFIMLFVQVTLFHYRQNFRHWSMWVPVIETPLIGILLLIYSFYNRGWFSGVLTVTLIIAFISGLYGSYLHIKGVGNRVGGFELRNFLVGPPLMLPGMMGALSLLGLIALHWGVRV